MSSLKRSFAISNVYLAVLIDKYQSNGLFWLVRKIIIRIGKELAWMFMLPISVTLHCLHVRRLLIRIEHIGHLAAEPDSFIKEDKLGLKTFRKFRYFLLAPEPQVSNQHLLSYWKPYFRIIENRLACNILSLMTRHYFMRINVSRYISTFFGTQDIYRIYSHWSNRPPILRLSDDDESWSKSQFEQLGIPGDKWYVCLHVREGGYLPHNELIQSHRNASVENVLLAIKEIVSRGGIVIRMGDPSMTPLPPINGVIDYARHPLKSARMDVVLCAKARFFLGCTSGLSFVSTVFGVPVVNVNMIPVQALAVGPKDLSIPKLLWSENDNRYLNFNEVLAHPMGGYYFTNQYVTDKVKPIENTPEDILDVTKEMLDRLDGKFQCSEQDELRHNYYMSLIKPSHYGYGAASRVGIEFLKKHAELLQ